MQTELYTITQIFEHRLLRIPDYQRGYAWQEKQLKDYWNDIEQLGENENHYTGVLTLQEVEKDTYKNWRDDYWIIDGRGFKPFYIVDGQQRLTTTIILIQLILETMSDDDVINYMKKEGIRNQFIYQPEVGGISRAYLFGYDIDNPSYEFLKKSIFGESTDSQVRLQETIYTTNLTNAKKFFKAKISKLNKNQIAFLYKKITQKLLFNIYTISFEIDVHVSFETMNNRGKPLSHLELLKNRLIYLSTKFDERVHEKEALRKEINECWKTIYHELGRNKDQPLDDDTFLYTHFILVFSDEINELEKADLFFDHEMLLLRRMRRGLFDSGYRDYLLERQFTAKSVLEGKISLSYVYDYVANLKSSVYIWYEMLNPEDSKFSNKIKNKLKKINRVKFSQHLPLMMVFLQKEEGEVEREKFLTLLEIILFHIIISKNYRYTYVNTFIDWADMLNKGIISSSDLLRRMSDESSKIVVENSMSEMSKYFAERGFYKWNGIHYFFFEYEEYVKEKSKSKSDKINWHEFSESDEDHETIEHIYPQNTKRRDWTEPFQRYNSKEKKLLRHVIGNLVPLSKSKNSSLQNKPFAAKKGEADGMVGYRYGSYSEIELTSYEEWTAVEILQRSVKLMRFMGERWKINFGNTSEIIEFLNMKFVLEKENLEIKNGKIKKKQ